LGFAIKIPDVGRSLKPFDYVVGIPVYNVRGVKSLRFIAVEAKKASGWTLHISAFRDHQIRALDIVESMAPMSSWIAIGFLDMPQMVRDWNRQKLDSKMKAEAYLIPWAMCKRLMGDSSLSYGQLVEDKQKYIMEYGKVGTTYRWYVGETHALFSLI